VYPVAVFRQRPLANLLLLVFLSDAVALASDPTQLQPALAAAMAKHPGTAIVLDVSSGKVLASHRLDIAARRVASPGSTIKPFTLLALLHSGHLNPNAQLLCQRKVLLAGHRMDCTHPNTPIPLNSAEALAYSCNSYFSSSASHLTGDDLRKEFERVGLTSTTGLASQEATGRMGRTTDLEHLQLQALGAEGIEVTPLELASAYRRLAQARKTSHEAALDVVYTGLEASTDYGMAHAAQPPSQKVAGKTGTAGSESSALTHGWFAGYAPAADPQIVLVVYLEHGRGIDAAAIARQIFTSYFESENRH